MNSIKTNRLLEVVDQVHTTYILRLPHYMLSASFGTSPCLARATAAILDNGSVNNIFCHSSLLEVGNITLVQTTKFLQCRMPIDTSYRFRPPSSYAFKLEVLSTRLSSIIQKWKYSLALDIRITTLTLLAILIEKWNSLKARYHSSKALRTSL